MYCSNHLFFLNRRPLTDAIQSIKTAFSLGAGTVSLEAVTEQKYTLVEYLIEKGLYRVPWLWSIIEVVRQTAHLGRVVVGLFQFYPSPELVPNNCELCNERVMDAIVEYNRTLRVEALDGLDCECRARWREALEGWSGLSRELGELCFDCEERGVGRKAEGRLVLGRMGTRPCDYHGRGTATPQVLRNLGRARPPWPRLVWGRPRW